MPENEIIAGIHRHREAVASECGYDAAKLMAYYRRREKERTDKEHPLVSHAKDVVDESCVVREKPPRE